MRFSAKNNNVIQFLFIMTITRLRSILNSLGKHDRKLLFTFLPLLIWSEKYCICYLILELRIYVSETLNTDRLYVCYIVYNEGLLQANRYHIFQIIQLLNMAIKSKK